MLKFFRCWAQNHRHFVTNSSTGLSKLLSRCTWEQVEQKNFPMKTLHFLVPTLSGKFSLCPKVFWLGCQNCIPPGNRIILRRSILFEFSPIFFGHWAKILRDFVDCLSTGLSKLHSSCPKELFELNKFCKSCRVLFITFELSDKKKLLSGRKISPCLSKVHSDCPLEQFEGRFFWKSFLAVFRDLAKKISVFPRRTFYGVVKTAFYGPRGAF